MKNMSLSRVTTFAVISALAMLSLAAPSSAQQGTTPAAPPAPVVQQAPAVQQSPVQSTLPQATLPAQVTPSRCTGDACRRSGRGREQDGQAWQGGDVRIVAVADVLESADVIVKAVMIGLAFASLVTWTIFIAKMLELDGHSAQAARRRSSRSPTRGRWRKRNSRWAPRAACWRPSWRRRCARRGCRQAFRAMPASRNAPLRALLKSCAPRRDGSGSAWACWRPLARRRPSSDCSAPSGAS